MAPPLTLAQLRGFDAIIDARSPSEYAEDHLPGAINCPTLDDEERIVVGTAYKQQGAFEAKRIGAPMAARNVARHISESFAGKPREWRPLTYCWRGGARSGALAYLLRQVGWDAFRLEGGYKAFRKQVVEELDEMPVRFDFRVVCGATGTGKSRLLEALAGQGTQVLDLEVLAAHRGSLLGDLPDAPQPTQKAFETAIWAALSTFDAARPVFVESESRKVGNLRVPEVLMERMRAGRCLRLDTTREGRIALLLEDYVHLIERPAVLLEKIDCLRPLHGAERIERWRTHASEGRWKDLVADLLDEHYDPAYRRSMYRNYQDAQTATPVTVTDVSGEGFVRIAREISAKLA
ncbi:tRNA 2-selenouridine(34) synthase MnmH [Betaproteobacteria bacterium GR16-43]|nr:tRNA 2-selenouridine(34) synthase MnmH [Betaproteobacteria bacterium GR16-43]